MRKYFWSIALLSLIPAVHATDRNAATCSFADVVTAYTAAVDGDRVLIPAGTCTWNAELTLLKGVAILGVSASSPTLTGPRFAVTVPTGKAWEIGQFAVLGTAGISVTGFSKAGRIHHMNWDNVTGNYDNRYIFIQPSAGGYSTGLIDHMTMTHVQGVQVHVREDGDGGNGSWMRPLDLGGPDAWYIEDSSFAQCISNPCTGAGGPDQYNVSNIVTDCDGGGRFVFRHNTVRSAYTEMHDAIVSGIRSCRKSEQYENHNITTQAAHNATNAFAFMGIRGGTHVFFNNVFDADAFGFEMVIGNYRSDGEVAGDPWATPCQSSGSLKACLNRSGGGTLSTCTTDANCGGVSGACVKIDGSGLGTGVTNYPCRDQIGTSGNAPQFIRPSTFWNNKRGSTQVPPQLFGHYDPLYSVEGRDFCVGPTTSSSDDATQPTTCGGKAVPYTPYTYPHPLQSSKFAPKAPTP